MSPTYDAARAARDEAMDRVDNHAVDAAWREWAWGWIAALDPGQEFTGDDVWNAAEAGDVARPHDGRALGPLLRRARAANLIAPTGTYRRSRRRHLSPVIVWRADHCVNLAVST